MNAKNLIEMVESHPRIKKHSVLFLKQFHLTVQIYTHIEKILGQVREKLNYFKGFVGFWSSISLSSKVSFWFQVERINQLKQ